MAQDLMFLFQVGRFRKDTSSTDRISLAHLHNFLGAFGVIYCMVFLLFIYALFLTVGIGVLERTECSSLKGSPPDDRRT